MEERREEDRMEERREEGRMEETREEGRMEETREEGANRGEYMHRVRKERQERWKVGRPEDS